MHTCTKCFQSSTSHREACVCGERHWPPLCCPGCDCESYEMAHAVPPADAEAAVIADRNARIAEADAIVRAMVDFDTEHGTVNEWSDLQERARAYIKGG